MMRHACALVVVMVLSSAAFSVEEAAVTPQPQEQPTVDATAQAEATASIRSQMETERAILENIALLGTPSWERASQRLIAIGAPAVPYLIEAMNDQASGAFPAEGYPLAGPGRATRTLPLKEAAFGVLNSLLRNHSNYNGALPGLDATAWREFWTNVGASVQFGKPQ